LHRQLIAEAAAPFIYITAHDDAEARAALGNQLRRFVPQDRSGADIIAAIRAAARSARRWAADRRQ
jgi:DNA-binding NarL/FixJ family response regulator